MRAGCTTKRDRGTLKKRKSGHTKRNVAILSVLVIVVVVAAVLGSMPNPQFFMTVHVYDSTTEYTSLGQLPVSALVANATITIAGPKGFGPEKTPTGILAISAQIPPGTYSIMADASGYVSRTIQYVVGGSCTNNEVLTDGNTVCHVLLRILTTR